jgi:predicted nucleic acid-binding protein
MTHYFLDTSALVKRYIAEEGTAWVQTLHKPEAGHTRWLVSIARVADLGRTMTRLGQCWGLAGKTPRTQ